jgi:hypothetical protein
MEVKIQDTACQRLGWGGCVVTSSGQQEHNGGHLPSQSGWVLQSLPPPPFPLIHIRTTYPLNGGHGTWASAGGTYPSLRCQQQAQHDQLDGVVERKPAHHGKGQHGIRGSHDA